MVTQLPKNEFISNSAAPPAVDEAGASTPAPLCDAPATLSPDDYPGSLPSGESEPSVMLACASGVTEAAGSVRTAASDISDIGEVFRVANLLCQEARQFVPDEEAIYSAALDEFAARAFEGDPVWADEAPLFLKSQG